MKNFWFLALFATQPLAALTIQIDYTYDTTNFFDTQAKRDAMESVAAFYGNLIQDKLLRIDPDDFSNASWDAYPFHPATGGTIQIQNLVVPEDTIIVYVGARDLGGTTRGVGGPGGWGGSGFDDWFDRISGRGSVAAASSTAIEAQTDFALWGGSISFDIDTTWNFSRSQNLTGVEFIKVALHEMAHVLGIGTADSWDNLISGGSFTGAASVQSHGSLPPIQSGGGHFDTALVSPRFGSFNASHGVSRPVLMLPSSTDNGSNFDVASDLDLAALIDCGWEIRPSPSLTTVSLGPSGTAFSWPSSSFLNYQVQRGSNLQTFSSGSGTYVGNGSIQSWTEPAPPATAAFYRLASISETPAPPPAVTALRSVTSATGAFTTASKPPRVVENCECGTH